MIYTEFEAGRMQGLKYKSWRAKIFFQRCKLVRNIVYTGIEASKKDCLCKGLIVWTWARKQGKGNARWMFCIHLCWNQLLWAFAAGVLWKTQPWDIFASVSKVATMMAVWKIITVFCSSNWNFSFPHYVTCFVCQRLQKFMEKVAK